MERRALEAAFHELAETQTIEQLMEQRRRDCQFGSAAIPVLVALLDTTDPQITGWVGAGCRAPGPGAHRRCAASRARGIVNGATTLALRR